MNLFLVLCLLSAAAATVVLQNGTQFVSGTMPAIRYDRPDFAVSGPLALPSDDVTGAIVLIASEYSADLIVADVAARGAVGAIIATTQLPPGWSFLYFTHSVPRTIPHVAVYISDWYVLQELMENVTIVSTENPWQTVFSREMITAFTAVFCGVFAVLLFLAVWALASSVPRAVGTEVEAAPHSTFNTRAEQHTFWTVYYALLVVQICLHEVASVDYNGIAALFGYTAANLITFAPVQLSYSNIWLFVIYVHEMMFRRDLAVRGFVAAKALYITLAVGSFLIGMLAVVATFIFNDPLSVAVFATMVSGGHQIASGLLFIIITAQLIVRIKATGAQFNRRVLYNWLALGVVIFLHGLLVLTYPAYFNSPIGNAVFYWLLHGFDAVKTFCFLYPFLFRRLSRGADSSSSGSASTATVSVPMEVRE